MTEPVRVGPKGQVVIAKVIRDQLGIEPGWQAVQRVVDGHVELRFLPPRHKHSLLGILSKYATRSTATEEEWQSAREEASSAMAREAMGSQQ